MLEAVAHDDASTACRPRVSPQQSRTTPNGALKRRPHGNFFSMAIKASKLLDSRQFFQQRLGILEVSSVKTFGEPAINLRQKLVRLCPLALLLP